MDGEKNLGSEEERICHTTCSVCELFKLSAHRNVTWPLTSLWVTATQ